MSDGLRDLELEERSAPPDLRERRPLPDARERGRSAPPPRSGLTVLALVLSVMALIVAGTALALVLRLSQAEPAEEEDRIALPDLEPCGLLACGWESLQG